MSELCNELKEEINRLLVELSFERNLNTILDNIRNYSLVLINDCKCDQNSQILQKFNEFNRNYALIKAKQFEDKPQNEYFGHKSNEYNDLKLNTTTEVSLICEEIPNFEIIESINESNIDNKSELKNQINEPNNGSNSDTLRSKRGRGRPKKKPSDLKNELLRLKILGKFDPLKRKRRAKTYFYANKIVSNSITNINNTTKRGRGRPKKIVYTEFIDELSEKSFDCNECKLRFDCSLNLLLHVNRDHKNIESFVCHECRQLFESKQLFLNHLSQTHENPDFKPDISLYNTDNLKLKRGRGRPRKMKYKTDLKSTSDTINGKRGRGRPKKNVINITELGLSESNSIANSKPEFNLITAIALNYRQNLIKTAEENTEQNIDLYNLNVKQEFPQIEENLEENYDLNSVNIKQELIEENICQTIDSNSMEINDTMNEEINGTDVRKSTDFSKTVLINSNEPQVIPTCDECAECFESVLELQRHLNTNHKFNN